MDRRTFTKLAVVGLAGLSLAPTAAEPRVGYVRLYPEEDPSTWPKAKREAFLEECLLDAERADGKVHFIPLKMVCPNIPPPYQGPPREPQYDWYLIAQVTLPKGLDLRTTQRRMIDQEVTAFAGDFMLSREASAKGYGLGYPTVQVKGLVE